jgi:hypothetical protein
LITLALPLTGAARYSTPWLASTWRSSADPSSEMEEHSTTIFGLPPLAPEASALPRTCFTSS